ncbi:[protein-PII] uridylyltransferase [Nocardioides iriomotensis]|uniref:Bifunctional uridylyltransferase/uridylyl-removing enzyme n=1 Tax=Nocardioides iriomotensis TaxID=715784 RepID=A0A4Q5J434_9ACTN|nr:[protein-PII] uridylyltransferase [Nocardioides iriomotensis]
MTAAERAERTRTADELCRTALEKALDGAVDSAVSGVALVAVGGYGRGELAPRSDLDVVLVHLDPLETVDVATVASTVWYPLWDAGADVDHSVRALPEVTRAARDDPRVALGLLDARHLAGDPNVTLRLRTEVLAHWRRDARRQLPDLHRMLTARTERAGELAHAAVPDLKESFGGLRDATLLKALVATWLVDVPHTELERSRQQLLDVRDELHAVVGRATDRVAPEVWAELASRLGHDDEDAVQRHVRGIGRRLAHLSRVTWHRVDAVLERPSAARRRAPELVRVGPGVAVSKGEVVLTKGTDVDDDPTLLLRAAAEAAERSLVLAPATASRLARGTTAIAAPWEEDARNLLVRLLAAGPGLLEVWETLDQTGSLEHVLPEWDRMRLLPHASVVHRFTVDRHVVETCIEASRLIRRVGRPDVLMVAALLHDIGKGGLQDHSVAGEPVAGAVAERIGFDEREQALVRRLVRRHLLLAETATTRDLEDPATVELVAERVVDVETLDLLEVLTEADARATSPKAWTDWRATLVRDLARRVRARLRGASPSLDDLDPTEPVDVPSRLRDDPSSVHVVVEPSEHGSTVTVVSGDRLGLIADAAGALAVQRLTVRAARAWTQGDFAVSVWEVAEDGLDPAVVRQRFDAVLGGRLDPRERIRRADPDALEPTVLVRHGASSDATVIEVRVDDRPGVVWSVCRALADCDVSVRSAHVATLGPQAVDVFYVVEPGAAALTDERSAEAVHAVREALAPTVTLDV